MDTKKQLLLCVDSSTPAGSVALVRGTTVLAEVTVQVKQRSHSDYLLRYVQFVFAEVGVTEQDIDALVVVAGPGSFTGLRVGLATVQGLAQALSVPIYPVSALQTVAFANGPSDMPVQVLIDARKQEVYTARYQWSDNLPRLQGKEQVLAPADLIAHVTTRTKFVGNGTQLYREFISDDLPGLALLACAVNNVARAGAAGLLVDALGDAAKIVNHFELRPVYVRLSDAEIHKQSC